MSSARMFDLVNSLHHHLTMDSCKERLPFAGKQIIIVGVSSTAASPQSLF